MYRDFHHPQPQEQTIRESVGCFLAAIDRSLRVACYRDTVFRIAFSHEVLFKQKTELTIQDFNSTYFPSGWNQCYQQFGSINPTWHGRCIVSLLRVKYILRFSNQNSFVKQQDGTFTHKPRIVEVLRVCIT